MKRLLVLGAGTAGTIVVNKLRRALESDEWDITIVDQSEVHHYQPGYLFIPFGIYTRNDVVKPRRDYIPPGVNMVLSRIEAIEPERNRVRLEKDNRYLPYDFLVIATGSQPRYEEVPGLVGPEWRKSIHEFYTLEGAVALARHLRSWEGGHLVLNISELPIKCPVAPLEFLFLADWYFHEQGKRSRVELTLATPLPGAFTKPRASQLLGNLLAEKNINVVPEFAIESVDADARKIISYDGQEIAYDLLVSVAIHMGDDVIARSGLGNDTNHVPVDKHTLLSTQYPNVFALGDAADVPTSKAGSVAHFQAEIFTENFLRYIDGLEMTARFDGHANCYIESGFGKGFLIDFNYEVEPLPGRYPLPGLGPFSLLQESPINHWGKMMFRWIYWNLLLKGKELPITTHMSMAGKWQ